MLPHTDTNKAIVTRRHYNVSQHGEKRRPRQVLLFALIRYTRTHAAILSYGRLLRKARPASPPVMHVFHFAIIKTTALIIRIDHDRHPSLERTVNGIRSDCRRLSGHLVAYTSFWRAVHVACDELASASAMIVQKPVRTARITRFITCVIDLAYIPSEG